MKNKRLSVEFFKSKTEIPRQPWIYRRSNITVFSKTSHTSPASNPVLPPYCREGRETYSKFQTTVIFNSKGKQN